MRNRRCIPQVRTPATDYNVVSYGHFIECRHRVDQQFLCSFKYIRGHLIASLSLHKVASPLNLYAVCRTANQRTALKFATSPHCHTIIFPSPGKLTSRESPPQPTPSTKPNS